MCDIAIVRQRPEDVVKQEIIDKVAELGFDVYMRDPKDSFMLFTDGKNIGYLQMDSTAGLMLTSVHKPNQKTGTGFVIANNLDLTQLDRETLSSAFIRAPHWAWAGDMSAVVKYRDMDSYLSANSWNAGYKLTAEFARAKAEA